MDNIGAAFLGFMLGFMLAFYGVASIMDDRLTKDAERGWFESNGKVYRVVPAEVR